MTTSDTQKYTVSTRKFQAGVPERPILHGSTVDPDVEREELVVVVPQYHVVLLDDDDHSYDYVIEMLMDIFGHNREKAYAMTCEVDKRGRVIVETTYKERAEMKRDQIRSYGADWRIPRSRGSMSAIVEPAA